MPQQILATNASHTLEYEKTLLWTW